MAYTIKPCEAKYPQFDLEPSEVRDAGQNCLSIGHLF